MGNHILRSCVPYEMAEQDCGRMQEERERNMTTEPTVGITYSIASSLANTVIQTKSLSGLSPPANVRTAYRGLKGGKKLWLRHLCSSHDANRCLHNNPHATLLGHKDVQSVWEQC